LLSDRPLPHLPELGRILTTWGIYIPSNEIYFDESISTESFSIELPTYENDALGAMTMAGGSVSAPAGSGGIVNLFRS